MLSVRLWIRDEFVDVEGGEDEEWEIEGEGLGDCCGVGLEVFFTEGAGFGLEDGSDEE